MKNYIGVTGIANISDNVTTVKSFVNHGIDMESNHTPMIGFLVNKKTLYKIPAKAGKIPHQRYPPVSSLRRMMEYSKGYAVNAIHFSARDDDNLDEEVKQLFHLDNIYRDNFCNTLQLNVLYPEKNKLEKILGEFSKMSIILQLPKRILEDKKNIAKKIKDYSGLIRGVLIDPSGGKGKEFDIELSAEIYKRIKEKFPELIVGIAGGLNGKNVYEKIILFKEKIKSYDFSIDAEGGLRIYEEDENKNVITDMLSSDLVAEYIFNANRYFGWNIS
ncbi:MAG: hypothetical protein M1416_00250 [Candidatus Pacearchaeota archaeon]|nr:hypothetical protein [Candidatus Pacearchaeota archaeon]